MRLQVESERWPYRTPFRISRGVEDALDVLLVTVHDGRGHAGRGEAAGVDYAGETLESMRAQLASVRRALAPAVGAGAARAELQRLLPPGGARNALDCALWDLEAKASGVPVWSRLGLDPPHPVVTCFTLGMDATAAMASAARAARELPMLKVKVSAGQHLEAVRAVHEASPDASIVVDPNQSWSIALLNELAPELGSLGVVLIEQPLPGGAQGDLSAYRGAIPLAADESCADRASLDSLSRAYRYVNIKLDKAGGLTEGLALARAARAAGYGIMVGCMAGTSLAMAPGMVIAQGATFVDLDGPLLHSSDRTPGIEYRKGVMQVPPRELWG
jgi:L-alanine-DL-glutamate epimerase-like enolase superfamily enzyme